MYRTLAVPLLLLLVACPEEQLGDLQVCRIEDYDPNAHSCTTNARQDPIRGAGAMCVLKVKGQKGEIATGEYRFLGDVVKTFTEEITTDEGVLSFAMTMDGMRELPGGDWTCAINVGQAGKQADFHSAGSTGQVQDLAVCPTTNTTDGPVHVCVEDLSGTGFTQQPEITCSATVVHARNHLVQARLRHQGVTVETSSGVEPDVELTVYAKHFAAPAGLEFVADTFNCAILVDRVEVVSADFTMTPR